MISQGEYTQLHDTIHHAIQSNHTVNDLYDVTLNDSYYNHQFLFGINRDTVQSLYDQILVRNRKQSARSIEFMRDLLVERVNVKGESLLEIAQEYHISSYKLAKVYIETSYQSNSNMSIARIIENPKLIKDERIRYDILKCIECDVLSCHDYSQIQECMGREYEELLISMLNRLQLCFETEMELRLRGKPKTPDILFLIPMSIMVTNSDGSNELMIVNWIDSKAMFADVETYYEHNEQFRGYINRYGKGLVIYWHGFHENLLTVVDENICLMTSCPVVWYYPTGEKVSLSAC